MAVTWLKHKYTVGRSYKGMKSTGSISGKGKSKVGAKNKLVAPIGTSIQLLNLSNEPRYCAGSGALLPKHGMAILYKGQIYVSRNAIPVED